MSVALRSPKVDIDTSGWRDATVGACSELVSTGPFGSLLHKWDYIEGGVPVINPVNLVDGEIRCDSRVTVSKAKAAELSAYRVRLGDILVARRGDIGRCAVATVVNNGWLCGTGCFFIRPSLATDPRFLALLLGSPEYQEKLQAASTGTTMLNLSNRALSELALRVPPLEEQKRIVAVLDQAFAALDRARANAEANLADATQLLESWVASVFRFGAASWETRTLPDISENLDRSRVPITQKDRKSGDIPYYGASGVVDHVADYIFDEDLLLVSEDGANLLARTYPIAFSISGKSWVNNHAHVLRFDDFDGQEFVRLHLNSISLEPYVSGMAQPKLNQGALNRIPIPWPEADERKRVVAKVVEIAACAGAAQESYQGRLADLAALRQSLLHKAFAGELA